VGLLLGGEISSGAIPLRLVAYHTRSELKALRFEAAIPGQATLLAVTEAAEKLELVLTPWEASNDFHSDTLGRSASAAS
jgi:hypothetical protein